MSDTKKIEITPSVAILIGGVLIAGAIVFTNTRSAPATAEVREAPSTATNVRAPQQDEHIIGSASAPLVLIEYTDLQCYYCGQAYPTLKRLVHESNGQIAWVQRHLPLESIHPQARPSALASECVAEQLGNEGFWKFTDDMFNNQSKMSPQYYEQVATELGADLAKFKSCVASEKYADKVDVDAAEAMQNGGTGTPYTVLYDAQGQTGVSGALPYATFMSVIKAFQDRQ
jgi:protein-disulfide isomerase